MKRIAFFITAVFLLAPAPAFSQGTALGESAESSELTDQKNKVFPTFNYGASASWLTRIIKQTDRSNFVLKEFLPGAYFTIELQNVPVVFPEIRVTAFYPLISKFNDVKQATAPLNIGIDLFAGVRYEFKLKVVKLSAGLGLHSFFMTADRWHYLNLGAAGIAGVELALSPGWSLLIDGLASIDNGNLGTNRNMEPFDIVYQYQSSIGVRYSKKMRNDLVVFKPKTKTPVIFDR